MMLVPYDKMIYFYAIEIGLVVRCQAVNFQQLFHNFSWVETASHSFTGGLLVDFRSLWVWIAWSNHDSDAEVPQLGWWPPAQQLTGTRTGHAGRHDVPVPYCSPGVGSNGNSSSGTRAFPVPQPPQGQALIFCNALLTPLTHNSMAVARGVSLRDSKAGVQQVFPSQNTVV